MIITTELKEWGNSYGIRITKKQAEELGLVERQKIQIELNKRPKTDGFGIFKEAKSYTKKDKEEFEGRQRW